MRCAAAFILEIPFDGGGARKGDEVFHGVGLLVVIEVANLSGAKQSATVIACNFQSIEGKAYALGESFLRFGWKERLQAVGNISRRTPRTVDDVLELNSDLIVFLGVGGSRFQVQIAASAGC